MSTLFFKFSAIQGTASPAGMVNVFQLISDVTFSMIAKTKVMSICAVSSRLTKVCISKNMYHLQQLAKDWK